MSIEIIFDSSPPPVCFHLLFKDPAPSPSTTNPGFPTGVENMGQAPHGVGGGGALQNLIGGMGGGLKSIHGGSMGGLKFC